ncbi:MAG: hypothetical protein FIA94_04145 [Nitrospirae bacterium]|nr:hypothetical protein [Nitrospirota bacterium]
MLNIRPLPVLLLLFPLFLLLLLMPPDLRSLLILFLPLMSQLLPLFLWPTLIALDAPGLLPFPISITVPVLPVTVKSLVRNPFIVPAVSVPIMVSVVASPARVYIIIELWNIPIESPTPIIIIRAIPAAFPWTPPPAVPEENFDVIIRNDVYTVRIGQWYHLRRRRKNDSWRERKSNTHIYLCH